MTRLRLMFALVLSALSLPATAQDCGVIGAVYPIAETDMRDVVQARLAALQANGGLAKLQARMGQTIAAGMDTPTPVPGLVRTQTPQIRFFDPTVRFPNDIRNSQGQIILPAGAAFNPLNVVSLKETLIFYDATDLSQVKWAEAEDKTLNGNDKLILVNGPVGAQSRVFHRPVYFDQGGRLTARFQIKQVPALVSQVGDQLKIEEVTP